MLDRKTAIDLTLAPTDVRVWALTAPIRVPRRNAFGVMTSRPALFVEMTLHDGTTGWGEVFCNWPPVAAPYRARLIEAVMTPLLIGRRFTNPAEMTQHLTTSTEMVALQAGEPGPFAQCIGGLDIAAWDAISRRTELPLANVISPGRNKDQEVYPYASALTAESIDHLVPPLVENGWRGFKIKVGFGREKDTEAIGRLRRLIGNDRAIMTDANQIWSLDQALEMLPVLADLGVHWIEEPLRCDAPIDDWRRLADAAGIPVAAGENLRGLTAFRDAAEVGIHYLQPDMIKWGGISQLLKLSTKLANGDTKIAPHYLGGAVGLAATAHFCSATGAEWLEVDCTENPLRDQPLAGAIGFSDGVLSLTTEAGHGVRPASDWLAAHSVG